MSDLDDGMHAQELKWGWSLETELKRLRVEREERDRINFPHGRTEEGKPAIPNVKLLGNYIHARPINAFYVEEREDYTDPSLPDERRGWFFCAEENVAYSTAMIMRLEQLFCDVIMADSSVMNLLNIQLDVKHCERLPAHVKENLLHNIRIKLYEYAGSEQEGNLNEEQL